MEWINKYDSRRCPTAYDRILIFSPKYPYDHPMRYRIISSQFLKFCDEATHWLILDPPKEE